LYICAVVQEIARQLQKGKKKVFNMDVQVGDILWMKKKHPCGETRFYVLRVGMDFKLKCFGCAHEIMVPRNTIEKRIMKIQRPEKQN
jgi:hypothetical protein